MSKSTRHTEQSEKFKEKARELGVEVDEEKLKRALRQMKERPGKERDDQSND